MLALLHEQINNSWYDPQSAYALSCIVALCTRSHLVDSLLHACSTVCAMQVDAKVPEIVCVHQEEEASLRRAAEARLISLQETCQAAERARDEAEQKFKDTRELALTLEHQVSSLRSIAARNDAVKVQRTLTSESCCWRLGINGTH